MWRQVVAVVALMCGLAGCAYEANMLVLSPGVVQGCTNEDVEVDVRFELGCGGGCPGQEFEFGELDPQELGALEVSMSDYDEATMSRVLTLRSVEPIETTVTVTGVFDAEGGEIRESASLQLDIRECAPTEQ